MNDAILADQGVVMANAADEMLAQLRATLGKMELVLGLVDDAIAWTDERGRIQWCNTPFDRLVGRPHLELLGVRLTELLPLAHDGNRLPLEAHPATLAVQAKPAGSGTYEFRHADRTVVLEVAWQSLHVGEGARQVVFSFRDITERKQAEQDIAAKNRELETLLHVTSHDLREPLRAIENFSLMLSQDYGGRLDDTANDLLRRVVNAAARLRLLLEDIVTLARARRIAPPSESTEAALIVQEVLQRLEPKVQQTHATVRVDRDLPPLRVDRTWATEAVYNLVLNALKFTKDREAPDVEIAPYRPNPGEAEGLGLIVRDRGPGVASEHRERIFELFQRAVGRDVEGTGAGLAIVREVAIRHGGHAWVRPREGGGSEFIITLSGSATTGGEHGPGAGPPD